MKKLIILTTLIIAANVSPVFGITFSVFDSSDNTSIETWINGGQVNVLEDFEGQSANWYKSLGTGVGTFTAEGDPGKGASSYNANMPDSDKPFFSIQDNEGDYYGRYNTTDEPGASKWLDSGDITKLTLDVDPKLSLTNLFFYLQDPSDLNAITTIDTNVNDTNYSFSSERDRASYFVGINLGDGETLSQIVWSTNTSYDGYGLDDFSTVVPVPEPATMLLFGMGLAGLASISLRKKKK